MMWSADVSVWKEKGKGASVTVKPRHFLYQTRRDLFPEGYLSNVEIGLWNRFHDWVKQQHG